MGRVDIIDEFIRRLKAAEQTHVLKPLCELFAKDAELLNMTPSSRHGKTSAPSTTPHSVAHFWSQYLNAFDWVQSSVNRIHDFGGNAVLEWRSHGKLATGLPVEYAGVSLLEIESEGTSGKQHIISFRTYFDSAALLPHAPRAEKTYSESVGQPEIDTHASS